MRRAPLRPGEEVSLRASLLSRKREGIDVVVAANGIVASAALVGGVRILAVGLQIGATPAGVSPTLGGGVLPAVLDHEFDLNEGTRVGIAVGVDLLGPGDLGEDRTVGPWIDMVLRDRAHG